MIRQQSLYVIVGHASMNVMGSERMREKAERIQIREFENHSKYIQDPFFLTINHLQEVVLIVNTIPSIPGDFEEKIILFFVS